MNNMIGVHTPLRTSLFYNYLKLEGYQVSDDSWLNDLGDSFEYLGVLIFLPNANKKIYIFRVMLESNYGTIDSDRNIVFTSIKSVYDFLVDYDPNDLFNNIDLLPHKVVEIINTYSNDSLTHEGCASFQEALEKVGYTFEYGLDAIPFGLRIADDLSKSKRQIQKNIKKTILNKVAGFEIVDPEKIHFVVIDENTFGTINPKRVNDVFVMAAFTTKGSYFPVNQIAPINSHSVRIATELDFEIFRISAEGYSRDKYVFN